MKRSLDHATPLAAFRNQNLAKTLEFAWNHWPLTGLLLLAAAIVMTPHLLERLFVYYPSRDLTGTPSLLGLDYSNLSLLAEDNVRLHGWFVPRPESRTTIFILHGNAGNISHRLEWIRLLHELGCHVLIIDYRGYGQSEGRPFEDGLYRDARAGYAWWTHNHAGEQLVVLGESLGGSVAVDLAAGAQPAGLILQSTFPSARDMANILFPLGLLQPLMGVHFDSESKIARIRCPKLVIHGTSDEIVPFRLGRKLYDAAPEPKSFYAVQGAGHNDLIWTAGPEYVGHLREFLSRL